MDKQFEQLKESEDRLARELANLVFNLKHGWLDNPVALQAQLLSVDATLKKRPDFIDKSVS